MSDVKLAPAAATSGPSGGPAGLRPGASRSTERDRRHTLVRDSLRQRAQRNDQLDEHACDTLFVFLDTARLVRRRLLELLAQHELSEAKFFALMFLRRIVPQDTTPAEVAYHSGISRSAMTDTLDQLEASRWIARRRSALDRRTVRVELTDLGRTAIDQAVDLLLADVRQLLDGFTSEQGRIVAAYCSTVGLRAEDLPAPASPACPGNRPAALSRR